jgi:hypothetical protein
MASKQYQKKIITDILRLAVLLPINRMNFPSNSERASNILVALTVANISHMQESANHR